MSAIECKQFAMCYAQTESTSTNMHAKQQRVTCYKQISAYTACMCYRMLYMLYDKLIWPGYANFQVYATLTTVQPTRLFLFPSSFLSALECCFGWGGVRWIRERERERERNPSFIFRVGLFQLLSIPIMFPFPIVQV